MIKCAHCKGRHVTVAEVKACSQGALTVRPKAEDLWVGMQTVKPTNLDEQRTFQMALQIASARNQGMLRGFSGGNKNGNPVPVREDTKGEQMARGYAPFPKVAKGYYAVEVDGVLKFYRVDRPTEGKWAGYTFLSVQASDDFWPIKNRDQKRAILELIEADPKAAGARYGQEIGRCWKCHRTLTDATSRANGIGPDCANKA